MSANAVRVVIADGHAATRFGVRTVLEAHGMVVCAEAATPDEAVAAVLEHQPDVVLIDVLMPPGDGITAARRIRDAGVETVVIMLTGSDDGTHLMEALRAGARGYLLKDTDPDRLPAAIEGVLGGEAAIPRSLVARMIDEIATSRPTRAGDSVLTEREHEVMDALARGMRTAEAATVLGLSEVTIRRHLSSAAEKLGASGREDALARFRAGLDPQK